MNPIARTMAGLGIAAGLCLAAGSALAQGGPPPQVYPEGIRGGSEVVPEKGVELRKYVFKETGEELPYSVFVSSKVKKGTKAPLVLALRGFTGTTLTIVRGTAVDMAEEGGYILVGALGYNNRAGFGVAARPRAGGAPAGAPGAAPPGAGRAGGAGPAGAAPPGGAPPAGAPAAGPPRGQPPMVGGTAETDPVKVTEYSEKDVMNVLAMVRKEFNIDDRRIYIMGHSQGGGGTAHLVEKYSDIWAGAALLAPALFDVKLTKDSKIIKVPLMLAVGEKDSLIGSVRTFSEQLKALDVAHEYKEYPVLDHGTIIMGSQREVFAFFAKHVKGKSRK